MAQSHRQMYLLNFKKIEIETCIYVHTYTYLYAISTDEKQNKRDNQCFFVSHIFEVIWYPIPFSCHMQNYRFSIEDLLMKNSADHACNARKYSTARRLRIPYHFNLSYATLSVQCRIRYQRH